MRRGRGGGSRWCPRRLARRTFDSGGAGLVDAIVAIGLLMIVLAPLLILLANSNSSSGSARDRIAAYSVASSYVDLLQSMHAVTPPSPPVLIKAGTPKRITPTTKPTTFVNVEFQPYLNVIPKRTAAHQAPPWPAHPAKGTSWPTQKVGGIPYTVEAAGGWCVQVTSGTTMGRWVTGALPRFTGGAATGGAIAPVAYWVAVKVSWGVGAHTGGGSVVQYAQLTAQASWPYTATHPVKTPTYTPPAPSPSTWANPTLCPEVLR